MSSFWRRRRTGAKFISLALGKILANSNQTPANKADSAKAISKGQDIKFAVTLTSPTQTVAAHIMCDEFGM